jgi:small conductance mechanosensitive channel
MKDIDLDRIQEIIITAATDAGLKIVSAIAIWFIGRWLIQVAQRLIRVALEKQRFDPTLLRYVHSIVSITLNVLLIVGILGHFGIQTTSFAALFATAGIAIGAAWAGLLSNFAAGVFLIILRPFKVGDVITANGVTGTVMEIGIFSSTIRTADHVVTILGNNKILSESIQNYSSSEYRRVDLKCQISNSTDPEKAIELLKEKLSAIPNVLADPPIEVNILEFNLVGPVLAVRPYCHNADYWSVYFEVNRVMAKTLAEAGFPVPMSSQNMIVNQS